MTLAVAVRSPENKSQIQDTSSKRMLYESDAGLDRVNHNLSGIGRTE